MERPRIRLLLDENVPSEVGELLHACGHEVELCKERFGRGMADDVIARVASDELQAVVVTWNRRHFQAMAARTTNTGQPSYPGMGIITFACEESRGADRLSEFLYLIEAEFDYRGRKDDKRVLVEIGTSHFKLLR